MRTLSQGVKVASEGPRPWGRGWYLLLGLLLGVVGGLVGGAAIYFLLQGQARPSTPQAVSSAGWGEVAARASAAVVTVISSRPAEGEGATPDLAHGSGVVIDGRGYIVTNEHVVQGAHGLAVVLPGGEKKTAKLVATDYPFTDIALLRIEGNGFAHLEWGDSDALAVGDEVLAIGSALGDYPNTVTRGIVSGLNRTWRWGSLVMEGMIQTDAALNQGNSGGALINARGELVGINTAVIRRTEGGEVATGLGFALPANQIRPLVEEIQQRGKVPRPFLGVVHEDLTPEVAARRSLSVEYGALLVEVALNTPAQEADLRVGDIILALVGQRIDRDHPFLNLLGKQSPHKATTMLVRRGDQELELVVTLTERP